MPLVEVQKGLWVYKPEEVEYWQGYPLKPGYRFGNFDPMYPPYKNPEDFFKTERGPGPPKNKS